MIALVTGATGMTGRELVRQLLLDSNFTKIITFVRRSSGVIDPKLTEHIVNFDYPEQWQHLVKGDVLFSCMGTTLRNAGSKPAQYKIDFEYQYEIAKAASTSGVKKYILVSSAGASASSPIFYSNMKGKLDEAVQKLPFESITILRPAQLIGEREEKRVAEFFAAKLMIALNSLGILKKYKPLFDFTLAKAMINATKKSGIKIYTFTEVHELGYDK